MTAHKGRLKVNFMYIIFDMDGVIADTEPVYRDGYLYAADKFGLPAGTMREAVRSAVGVTDERERAIMEEAFADVPWFDLEETFRACREYFDNIVDTGQVRLKPGVLRILDFLKDEGIPAGLASSSPRERIDRILKPYGVLPYFDVIISGDMVTRGKPDPEIFMTCAGRMGLSDSDRGQIYVIEDSANGIRAAAAAGMRPVMVPDTLEPDDEIRKLTEVILPSLSEVMAWIGDKERECEGSQQ